MLDCIWAQIACKIASFFLYQKHCSKFAKCHPPATMLKVACLAGDVIKNCVLCCRSPAKFKLIIFGFIFDI